MLVCEEGSGEHSLCPLSLTPSFYPPPPLPFIKVKKQQKNVSFVIHSSYLHPLVVENWVSQVLATEDSGPRPPLLIVGRPCALDQINDGFCAVSAVATVLVPIMSQC